MSKFNFETTEFTGKITRYSRSAGRNNAFSNYDYLEVGDNYLTGLEINKTIDHLTTAYNNGDDVTLYVSKIAGKSDQFISAVSMGGKFYCLQGGSKNSASVLSGLHKFTKALLVGSAIVMVIGLLGSLDGLILLGFLGTLIGVVTHFGKDGQRTGKGPFLLALYEELDRIAAELSQDGKTVVRVPFT